MLPALTLSEMKQLIEVAAGREEADLVLKNCQIVDVGAGIIRKGDIAVLGKRIAATGSSYRGREEIDCGGLFALPGLIDSHIHIESAMVTPEEISRLLVPFGTATIIADPHEIVNVAGLAGLDYMRTAAGEAALHIEYMLPSCVPATPFENAGAVLTAADLAGPIRDDGILGLAEMMNFPGIIHCDEEILTRVLQSHSAGKPVDGHSPGISGKELAAYAAAGIRTDHECSTVDEMLERLSSGMFVLMRQGSACHNLETLLQAVTPQNARRCLLCSDDRQPKTILEEGHLNDHLKRCVKAGIDPVTAVQMATLNAAEAYGLHDRGALFPGRRADITLVEDLNEFRAARVWLDGAEAARGGKYLAEVRRVHDPRVLSTCHVRNFSRERLELRSSSDRVHVIEILPGGVVTGKGTAHVQRDSGGIVLDDPAQDLVRLAVVERHHETGNVAVALLRGYGLKEGAVALSIAHDSHNLILAGRRSDEMELAGNELIRMGGGIVLVKNGSVIGRLPLPVAGLMSDQSGEFVNESLERLHGLALHELGVSPEIDPIMTLCFMSLPVIPALKLTDRGLFDVGRFDFIPPEAEEE